MCESGSTYCQKWLTQASKSLRLVCNYCGPEPVSLAPKYCQEMLTQAFIASCDLHITVAGMYLLRTQTVESGSDVLSGGADASF